MHITFDYLAVGVILFALATFAISTMFPVLNSSLTGVKEEQLQPVAEKTMTKLCSTPGKPENWGTAYEMIENGDNDTLVIEGLKGFGLARFSNGEVLPEELDADKVLRLVPTTSTGGENLLYVDPLQVADLLGLTWDGAHLKYGFYLELRQALNLTATPIKWYVKGQKSFPYAFDLNVKNSEGVAAAGSTLKCTYVVFWMNGNDLNYSYLVSETVADWEGHASVEYNVNQVENLLNKGGGNSVMLFAYAEYFGIKSQTVTYESSGDVLEATVIGDKLFLEFPSGSELPEGARHVRGVFGISYDNVVALPYMKEGGEAPYVINKGSKTFAVFDLGPLDETLDTLGVYVIYLGKPVLVFARRTPPRVQFGTWGSGVPYGLKVVTLRRMVSIGELSYWAELFMWRTAEI